MSSYRSVQGVESVGDRAQVPPLEQIVRLEDVHLQIREDEIINLPSLKYCKEGPPLPLMPLPAGCSPEKRKTKSEERKVDILALF